MSQQEQHPRCFTDHRRNHNALGSVLKRTNFRSLWFRISLTKCKNIQPHRSPALLGPVLLGRARPWQSDSVIPSDSLEFRQSWIVFLQSLHILLPLWAFSWIAKGAVKQEAERPYESDSPKQRRSNSAVLDRRKLCDTPQLHDAIEP